MPCERIGNAIFCSNKTEQVGSYLVEFPAIGCPVALKPNGEIYQRIPRGRSNFYKVVTEFLEAAK